MSAAARLRARVSRDRIDVTSWDSEPGSEWIWGGWRVTMSDGKTSTYPTWSRAMAAARNTLRTARAGVHRDRARREWDPFA